MGEELEHSDKGIERSWKHPGLRADVQAVLGILSPDRAKVIVQWLDSWHARDEDRGRAAFEAATEAAEISAEELLDTIMANERLTDLFRMTMELAARSGAEEKIRALGKALATGALAADDAEFDRAQLILRTVGELEAMDVRVLLTLVEYPLPAWVSNPDNTYEGPPNTPVPPLAIRAHLVQLGVARERAHVDTGGYGGEEVARTSFEITDYGREVLALLGESGKRQGT